MPNRCSATILVLLAGLTVFFPACIQVDRPPQSGAVMDQEAALALTPRHDISGTWEPANGPGTEYREVG